MPRLITDIESRSAVRSRARLESLQGVPPEILHRIGVLLDSAPDPDNVARYLNQFWRENPNAFLRIGGQVTTLRYLMAVLSYSAFLSEAVLKNPQWLEPLGRGGDMHRVLMAEEYETRLRQFVGWESEEAPSAVDLARFRREQLLRIVIRDVLGLGTLSDVTLELSNLADAILDLSYRRIRASLAGVHGEPLVNGEPAQFSVIALGKLGGRELNYSSDIDLMFIYDGAGDTDGPHRITNKEFFKKIANSYTELLSTYTGGGMCYRVDLRLRPDGRYGEVCHSLEGARNYYRTRGRDWELQMLIKGRVAAGEPAPGVGLLEFVEPLIYSTTLDFKAVESVSEARERINEKLKRSAHAGVDIKLARGGIRDIEFLVQCLQRLHGGREPWVRHGGTLFALFRLRDKDLLSDSEYSRLVAAYQFLRNLEHRLQFNEDRQIHTLPQNLDELELLARKMPESQTGTMPTAGTLQRELHSHFEAVRELYDRVVRSQRASYYATYSTPNPDVLPPVWAQPAQPTETSVNAVPAGAIPEAMLGISAPVPSPHLARYLETRAPYFAEAVAQTGPHDARLEYLIEKLVQLPEYLDSLENYPELRACTLDVFNHSRYFADQLIRYPELLREVLQACGDRQGRLGFEAPEDAGGLRRYFREQMTRIQADSIYHRVPIFKTLKRTSQLAESIILAAYRIATQQALEMAPPETPGYQAAGQMMTVALGRLGMREFDLASDADLVFVIPDHDVREMRFWTAVAERMIHVISAYTGDGVIFIVDTRLRPNGRDGALVQTESNYKDYLAHHAEAWEGIAYMKSRAVAGDMDRAAHFLKELQIVDWRRYGQGGRSRAALAQMRSRLEREQGSNNLLKAGRGGYWDIDFVCMYLRLKGAGMFFPVLNTPERIDVIEKMGHLEREEAEFLLQAAVFYRAVDHGLRVLNGHAEGRLPSNPVQAAILADLVSRWTPERLHGPLPSTLKDIRTRTREFYHRVFGE
jgi:glutamate-ammonia-ligase adenylyltransferase